MNTKKLIKLAAVTFTSLFIYGTAHAEETKTDAQTPATTSEQMKMDHKNMGNMDMDMDKMMAECQKEKSHDECSKVMKHKMKKHPASKK
ncbi:MAG: hypothetical protein H7256_14910 [Bdellovibrio sp.]|nr:hypothetical protein [Bdellovibrio sp.]